MNEISRNKTKNCLRRLTAVEARGRGSLAFLPRLLSFFRSLFLYAVPSPAACLSGHYESLEHRAILFRILRIVRFISKASFADKVCFQMRKFQYSLFILSDFDIYLLRLNFRKTSKFPEFRDFTKSPNTLSRKKESRKIARAKVK